MSLLWVHLVLFLSLSTFGGEPIEFDDQPPPPTEILTGKGERSPQIGTAVGDKRSFVMGPDQGNPRVDLRLASEFVARHGHLLTSENTLTFDEAFEFAERNWRLKLEEWGHPEGYETEQIRREVQRFNLLEFTASVLQSDQKFSATSRKNVLRKIENGLAKLGIKPGGVGWLKIYEFALIEIPNEN
jgi:hypothetical protein